MISIETEARMAKILLTLAQGEHCIEPLRRALSDQYDYDSLQVFKFLDPENKNYVNAHNLMDYLCQNGIQITQEEAQFLIMFYDRDSDKVLNYREFTELIQGCFTVDKGRKICCGISMGVDCALKALLEKEICLIRTVIELICEIRTRNDFDIQGIFNAVKGCGFDAITRDSLRQFLYQNEAAFCEGDLDSIMKRIDFNKDCRVTLNEWTQFLTLPSCASPYRCVGMPCLTVTPPCVTVTSPCIQPCIQLKNDMIPCMTKKIICPTEPPLIQNPCPTIKICSPTPCPPCPPCCNPCPPCCTPICAPSIPIDTSPTPNPLPCCSQASGQFPCLTPCDNTIPMDTYKVLNSEPEVQIPHVSSNKLKLLKKKEREHFAEERGEKCNQCGCYPCICCEVCHRYPCICCVVCNSSPCKCCNACQCFPCVCLGREPPRPRPQVIEEEPVEEERKPLKGPTKLGTVKRPKPEPEPANHPYEEGQLNEYLRRAMQGESQLECCKRNLAAQGDFNCQDAFKIFQSCLPGNEFISSGEIKNGLNLLGLCPSDKEIKIFLNRFDLQKTGVLNYPDFFDVFVPFDGQFRNMIQRRCGQVCSPCRCTDIFSCPTICMIQRILGEILDLEKELNGMRQAFGCLRFKIKDIFRKIDKANKGTFTGEDLKKYLKEHRLYISDNDCDLLFIRLDKNRDGKVSLNEFEDELKAVY